MFHRAYSFRLKPTPAQAEQLAAFAGAARFIYNLAWEQRRTFHRPGRRITFAQQCRELTDLRAQHDWLGAAPRSALDYALRDVDAAFSRYYTRRAGYPRPRKKGLFDAFRVNGHVVSVADVNRKWGVVRLPKIGAVLYRKTRQLGGRIVSAAISREGKYWRVSIVCEVLAETAPATGDAVGVDRGVVCAIALSTGETLPPPPRIARLEKRRRRAQRILARRRKGSRRYAAQRARVAAIHAGAARIRLDFNHRTTTALARRFSVVALEDLKVRNMTASARGVGAAAKAGLNRSIMAVGWRQFETLLGLKLAERGGHLIKVNPAYTSQTCSACGVVDQGSRKSQASFICVECGHCENDDVNAAKNILRRSTSAMDVEGGHWAPCEASTGLAA